MGYYSSVGLCLTEESAEQLEVAIQEIEDESIRQMVVDHLAIAERHSASDGSIAYLWQELKWYYCFDDVSFIEKFTQSLPYQDFLFIRIGEGTGDTETRGGYWDNPFHMTLGRELIVYGERDDES